MKRYFGTDGLLEKQLEHFESRPLQLQMAEMVSHCLGNPSHLLVEAGTGTGKTWAYLIPAILSGKRVLISTGTKTLQDQILDHDVPILKRLLFPQLRAVCLKGRRNYLCLRRFAQFSMQPSLWDPEARSQMRRLQQWVGTTETGDRADIPWLPDQSQLWQELTASGNQCLGTQCDRHGPCFLTRMRRRAAEADLVVVNHHLFFADLALRNSGIVELLPEYQAVVFDEAHQLEDIVALYYGVQFASFAVRELGQDLAHAIPTAVKDPQVLRTVQDQLNHQNQLLKQLYTRLDGSRTGSGKRIALDDAAADRGFAAAAAELSEALKHLAAIVSPHGEQSPDLENAQRRAVELSGALQLIAAREEPNMIYWYEPYTKTADFVLYATPIDTAPIVRQELLAKTPSVILTSATLSAPEQGRSTFTFIKQRLGFGEESRECLLPSPFDFEHQTLLYVPDAFPEPQHPDFCPRMIAAAARIIQQSRGRALFLFTSYRNLHEVVDGLSDLVAYPLLVQGERPKRVLLGEFKASIESVLLATYSFWEGIDVPGEALSCVLIDKLPFEVPTDPIVKARLDHLGQAGQNPFYQYQVPRAAIHLKQGVGRLIRNQSDRGVVVIFDIRLFSKSYGKLFRQALPPLPCSRDISAVERFFRASV